jgi:hypothetical protein
VQLSTITLMDELSSRSLTDHSSITVLMFDIGLLIYVSNVLSNCSM